MAQGLNYRLTQASLVLLAEDVNAGGINPDYLQAKGIVPGEWNWDVSVNTVATPFASVVKYVNGTNVLANQGRVQAAHDEDGFDPTEIRLDYIIEKYVQANPDLHYTTIGANFHAVIYDLDEQSFLKSRLIRNEITTDLGFDEVRTVELVSNSDKKNIAMHFNPGIAKERDEDVNVLLVRGNFERHCNDNSASEQVRKFVSKFKDDWEEFQSLLKKIFIRE